MSIRTRIGIALLAASSIGIAAGGAAAAPPSSSRLAAETPASDANAAPQPGGRLVFAVNQEPLTLDVHAGQQNITNVIGRHFADTLLSQASDGSIHPGIATYEVNDDATTYTFHLRDGISFSDGTPLDAEAVKATFDRIADPATASVTALSLLGPYRDTTVVDPLTVQVEFTEPFAPFAQAATEPFLGILSPTAIEAGTNPATQPIGSGPFVVESFTPNESVVLTRRADYDWAPETALHSGPAYVDEVVFRFVPEDTVRAGLLSNGEADVIAPIPAIDVAGFGDNEYTVLPRSSSGAPWTLFFNAGRPPFDDANLRRAVLNAIDVQTVIDTIYLGEVERAWTALSSVTPFYDASLEGSWGHDPDAANSLLDDAGWTERNDDGFRIKDGNELVFDHLTFSGTLESRDEALLVIQSQLAEVGIRFNIITGPFAELFPIALAGEYSATDASWGGSDPDVLRALYHSGYISDGESVGSNSGIDDAEVDRLLAEGAASLDPDVRAAAYGELQRYLLDQAYSIPVYVPAYHVAVRPGVHDVHFGSRTDVQFYDAWIEN